MYIFILTENKTLKYLFRCVFLQLNCSCKTVCKLSDLFTEIKNKVPDCIILDKTFFPDSCTRQDLKSYIGTGMLFEKFGFSVFLYDERYADWFKRPIFQNTLYNRQNDTEILKNMDSAAKKLKSISQIPEGFRPVEKKLYSLLKNRAEEELSLEEMCTELWGEKTEGNTKTLYTYIYRIKHILEENISRPEILVKAKKGCYKLTFESL